MRRVRAAQSLVHDAVDGTVELVREGHESTARSVMRVLGQIPPVAGPARQVDRVRRAITAGILDTVKGVNHVVADVSDAAFDALSPAPGAVEPPVAMRSDIVSTPALLADAVVGAVNGVVGDHLAARENGLDLGMALRTLDAWIGPDGTGIPAHATERIALFVHGVATTEWSWCLDAERHLGDPAANFGTRLQAELGYTPVFARYNSGRHISDNGRALSARLGDLVAAWPVPVEEVLLIGHSMGGLVLRSACAVAHAGGAAWPANVRRVITLSSPMQGAPLEKFGNVAAAMLGAVDLPATAIGSRLIRARSAGIKDLRHGYVQDAEWRGHDPDGLEDHRREAPVPPHIAWCFVCATLADSPAHPVSRALGDALVRVESATGPANPPAVAHTRHVGGVHHAAVQVHPKVYEVIRAFVGR
jgi:pimeloyl-ACP methyl ester carboxylesterase